MGNSLESTEHQAREVRAPIVQAWVADAIPTRNHNVRRRHLHVQFAVENVTHDHGVWAKRLKRNQVVSGSRATGYVPLIGRGLTH